MEHGCNPALDEAVDNFKGDAVADLAFLGIERRHCMSLTLPRATLWRRRPLREALGGRTAREPKLAVRFKSGVVHDDRGCR